MDTVNLQVIRESFGRVAYTHKTHEKAAEIESSKAIWTKWINVILTTLTSSSIVGSVITDNGTLQVVSSLLAAVTLAFVIFQLSFRPDEEAEKHRQAAKELWYIRERCVNLLADIKNGKIPEHEIVARRDNLLTELRIIYKSAPQTTSKAYKAAQQALKINEELTFSDEEIDNLLPAELRIKM